MADIARSIEAEPLTAAAWRPFGWIPVRDTDPADGAERLSFEWIDVHLNVISATTPIHRRCSPSTSPR